MGSKKVAEFDSVFDFDSITGEAAFVSFVKDIPTRHGRVLALRACFRGEQGPSNFTDAVMLGLVEDARVAWKAVSDTAFDAKVTAACKEGGKLWWRSLSKEEQAAEKARWEESKRQAAARAAAKAERAANGARVDGEVDRHNLGDEIERVRNADAPKADKPAEPKTPEEWRELKKAALAEGREWESGIQPDFEEAAEILADAALAKAFKADDERKVEIQFKAVWEAVAHGTPVWTNDDILDLFGPIGLAKWKADKAANGESSKNDKVVRMARFRVGRALEELREEAARRAKTAYERLMDELAMDAS